MTVADSLREGWALAASALPREGLRVVSLKGGEPASWATVDEFSRPGVLVLVPSSQSLASALAAVNKQSAVIAGEICHFEDNGEPVRGLHLWSEESELTEVFVAFCELLIERCRQGAPIDRAFALCMEEFRRFVAIDEVKLPSDVIGLVGELLVLSQLVKRDMNAVRYWAYPSLDRHDFRHGSVAIEVKASLRSRQSRKVVQISALDQLEPPGGGALYLHWLLLERDPGGTIGIACLMDVMTKNMGSAEAANLWRRVEANGDLRRFRELRFSAQEHHAYRVEAAFPRLTASRLVARRLDPGIARVTYELDLATVTKYECDPGTSYAALTANDPAR